MDRPSPREIKQFLALVERLQRGQPALEPAELRDFVKVIAWLTLLASV